MPNERKTEAQVRKRLEKSGFFKDGNLSIEEQKSDSPRIDKLLKNASKKGQFKGYPEFIVSSKAYSDFLIVIECKADATKHISKTLDKYSDFAVDGALLYASFLSKEFDVLAIAVSGETEATLRISHYLHLRGADRPVEFPADEILPFDDYHNKYLHSEVKFRQDYDALLNYSRELNEELHAKKIKESDRGLLIAGILVALGNPAFKKSFKVQPTAKYLANNLVESIANQLKSANLPLEKISNLEGEFSFIKRNTTLTSDKDFFVGLIEQIDNNVNTFIRTHKYHDTLGQFYVQFLQYANNDKGLGIFLTPPHIAELFADLAEINKNSVVFDNCCGTAGLLIAAMKRMLNGVSQKEEESIKKKQLIGIEFQGEIYALAVSNMIVHDDGKTNIVSGDCFELSKGIKAKFKPNVGVLNPPYKSKGSTIEELVFVLNNLSVLQAGGKCIAIIPFSCAIGDTAEILELKRKLLEKHTLEAVMSMPADLFHDSNVGVVTCIMVFTAHRPHPSGKKTWFGYWRDDGFIKTKHRGRIAAPGKWEEIKKTWLDAYHSRDVIEGLSVMKEVKADDEWCPEAYMETDYSTLTQAHFEKVVQNYAIYRLVGVSASAEE
jgi:type I restriction-modification system DNA methylase subunit